MNFNTFMPVKVLSGDDVLSKNSAALKALGSRCLLVTGKHSAKLSGALQDFTNVLHKEGIAYTLFDGIAENPTAESCIAAGRAAAEFQADFIAGIGGGSALDAAKAAAVIAANPTMDEPALLNREWKVKPLPIVLVGTTSGTGSEVSAVSVLTWRDGRKRSVTHPDLYARVVFADPRYTYSMPKSVALSTGLDALCHAAEGFFTPACGDVQTVFAQKAIPMLWQGLRELAVCDEESHALSERMYYGALWAGLVLNATGTCFPHPFGYILTEDFGIPHGRACAVFLPALIRHTLRHAPDRANAFLDLIGCGFEEFESFVLTESGCADVRMTAEQVEEYAARWVNLKNFLNVPGGYTPELGKKLFTELFVK